MTDALLARRAVLHAALAEPVRLRVVQELLLADASPGELGQTVGLPTNLLAFHLRTLEDAGVVRRARSEGDARRTYVRLRWDDPEVARLVPPAPPLPAAPPRVVFVCTRNSARSQLAAATWRRLSAVPALSAGTDPAPRVHPGAADAGRRRGLRIATAPTRDVASTVAPDDLVVCVCDNAHEDLRAYRERRAAGRWLHWAVPDPVRSGTGEAFDAACDELDHRLRRLAGAVDGAVGA